MVTFRRSRRRGASAVGCLVSLVLAVAVLYYGINLGRLWWRYWEIKDRMRAAARFALNQTDAQLQARLQADAQEIGLPPEGHRFRIQRTRSPATIVIRASYRERVDLPLVHRTFAFHPEVVFRQ
jgi:hypothetical protein